METINNTQTVKVEETQSAVEQKNNTSNSTNTNNVVDLNKLIFNNRNVTPHILLDHFKGMLSNDKIVFYNKRGVKNEFDKKQFYDVDELNQKLNITSQYIDFFYKPI